MGKVYEMAPCFNHFYTCPTVQRPYQHTLSPVIEKLKEQQTLDVRPLWDVLVRPILFTTLDSWKPPSLCTSPTVHYKHRQFE